MSPPAPENAWQAAHAELLCRSYQHWTQRPLLPDLPQLQGADLGRALWQAPFALLSHDTASDPLLTYGNQTTLRLFDYPWPTFITTPSRFTAEAPEREERSRLLQRVREHGFIDDYSGTRIARDGRRFRIHRATVWNLIDDAGRPLGQAATFSEWTEIPPTEARD
ncbi:MAG: MEKHLA domain-containing protein [Verrucomicrobiales bacterium]|nr:MEKHLA domain-containing protein [Verrucomicrobiales bacterium]